MAARSRPNVLFVVLDTARAQTILRRLDTGLAPTMSRIASEGTTFTDATTTAPWTLPSHAAMFTGEYTSDHGVNAGNISFAPDTPPLAMQLTEDGYRTAGISGNVWISPEFGFDAGFDQFSMSWDLFWDAPDLSSVISDRNTTADGQSLLEIFRGQSARGLVKGAATAGFAKFLAARKDDGAKHATSRTIKWLDRHGTDDQPFFYFLNYIEPHLPYEPPGEYIKEYLPDGVSHESLDDLNQDPWEYIAGDESMSDRDFETLKRLYRAEIAYLDSQLERLYESLADLGILDETAIVLVGDHGENIGEHGLMDHQYCLYETLTHVPLLIRYPEEFAAGETVSGPVEVRDLYPTVRDLAGLPTTDGESGSTNSLLPDDGAPSTREHAISEYLVPQPAIDTLRESVSSFDPSAERFDRALRAIKTDRWKLIESPNHVELYDLQADPDERRDLSGDRQAVSDRLQRTLRDEAGELSRGNADDEEISEQNRERLENLGYLQ